MVLSNLKMIVDHKSRLGKRMPKITWKFIVHKHNENEIEGAIKIAKDIGVSSILFTPIYLADFRPGTADNVFNEEVAREWLPVINKDFIFDLEG